MKIYLLSKIADIGYDEYDAKVIRSSCESLARECANKNTGDEGAIWTDKNKVTCEELDLDGCPGVILESFNAG